VLERALERGACDRPLVEGDRQIAARGPHALGLGCQRRSGVELGLGQLARALAAEQDRGLQVGFDGQRIRAGARGLLRGRERHLERPIERPPTDPQHPCGRDLSLEPIGGAELAHVADLLQRVVGRAPALEPDLRTRTQQTGRDGRQSAAILGIGEACERVVVLEGVDVVADALGDRGQGLGLHGGRWRPG
jgi:hypothetical protein